MAGYPSYLRLGGERVSVGSKPILMGIVNVTPDSFSDGGRFLDHEAAIGHGLRLLDDSADWLDVGGESTRPGAEPVPLDEELRRVVPVIEGLRRRSAAPISIDTYKPETARAALAAGATVINDVTGFRDPAMIELAVNSSAALVVMHMRGTPKTMMEQAVYEDVIGELLGYFEERLDTLTKSGVDLERIILDPGIGFAKRRHQSLEIIRRIDRLVALGRPVLLGASRKSVIGEITGRREADRLAGTIATILAAWDRGVSMFRVHDVGAMRDALAVQRAIDEPGLVTPS
jgi:dihydropteroate synthase